VKKQEEGMAGFSFDVKQQEVELFLKLLPRAESRLGVVARRNHVC
jgi:hypothetical protein